MSHLSATPLVRLVTCPVHPTRHRRAPRGLTLLEVLFAIGVVAVGLLGVMAIIPLGMNQVGKGNTADRAARTGLNGVAQFKTRAMNRPINWVYDLRAAGSGAVIPVFDATRFTVTPHVPTGYSFAIDPLFVSVNRAGRSPAAAYPASNTTYHYDARFFPYFAPSAPPPNSSPWPPGRSTTEPRMLRITLQRRTLNLADPAMDFQQAERIFVSRDDLVFNISDDITLPPAQDFGTGAVRQYEGAFSWLATLTPVVDGGGQPRNEFVLSVVVINRRDPSYEMFRDINANGTLDAGEPPTYNERLVSVAGFQGAGYAGGDLTLSVTLANTVPPEDEAAEANAILDTRKGDWIMLAGSSGLPAGGEWPEFRWYRVVGLSAEAEEVSPNVWQREVTLQGADWRRINWQVAPGDARYRPTQATLLTGAVAVYEKVIQLDTSSLWLEGG